jgi:hypothetical protein
MANALVPCIDNHALGLDSCRNQQTGVIVMEETYRSPWFNLCGYLACSVKYADGTKKTVLQHREVMEQHLGRTLASAEVVHHKDKNKRNNAIDNLEVISQSDHARHHKRVTEYVTLTCVRCRAVFVKQARGERHRIKLGCLGPFCGKSCAGSYQRTVQIRNGQANLRKPRAI